MPFQDVSGFRGAFVFMPESCFLFLPGRTFWTLVTIWHAYGPVLLIKEIDFPSHGPREFHSYILAFKVLFLRQGILAYEHGRSRDAAMLNAC